MNETNEKKHPEKKFRAGPIVATIWKNQTQKDGKTVEFNTISFERSYKDKNDQWQTTSALRTNDIPKAMLVLNKAYEHITLAESSEGYE